MSADAATVVSAVEEFGVVGSDVVDVAVAVFEMTVPFAVVPMTVAEIVTVAVAPIAKSPMEQVMGAVPEQLPEPDGLVFVQEPVAPVNSAGIESETVTPLAVLPVDAVLVFVTVIE
jgi:hypothetical protein